MPLLVSEIATALVDALLALDKVQEADTVMQDAGKRVKK
jgi:hypothetical protein